jgi:hypothetical protein
MSRQETIGNKKEFEAKNEQILIDRFEVVNVDDVCQMQEILEMSKDPVNMTHLAGISSETGISDIIQHYKKLPEERDGRVALDKDGHVLSVFEIMPFDISKLTLDPDGDKAWEIRSGILNRFIVRSDMQGKKIGAKTLEYAEEVAFLQHNYSNLIAAIILDHEQEKKYEKAYREGDLNKFSSWYELNDARGGLYVKSGNFEIHGVLLKNGGYKEGDLNHVLLVQQTKIQWEKKQKFLRRMAP